MTWYEWIIIGMILQAVLSAIFTGWRDGWRQAKAKLATQKPIVINWPTEGNHGERRDWPPMPRKIPPPPPPPPPPNETYRKGG
jgi:hypothetical protein